VEILTQRFNALGTQCEIILEGNLSAQLTSVASNAVAEIRRFEAKYSRYQEKSLVSEINQNAGKRQTKIDPETFGLLNYASQCFIESGGLFDITSGVLRSVWQKGMSRLPLESDVRRCLELVDWRAVSVGQDFVFLELPGMELDFGGFGKEYIADLVAVQIRSNGIEHGLINLGGDIAVVGPHVSGEPWIIGIRHPVKTDEPIALLELFTGGLTTSGSYERYFDLKGHRYSHILNPNTGWPVDGLLSVSAIASQTLVAGTICTIALLKGAEDGLAWLNNCGTPYLAVDSEFHISGELGPAT